MASATTTTTTMKTTKRRTVYNIINVNLFALVLLLCLLEIAFSPGGVKAKTNCDPKVMDKCAATVFVFGKRSVYLPKNEAEMVPHCQEEFDAINCVKTYARKCLDPFSRQVVGVLLHGASQVINSRCKPKGVKEYLSHKVCIERTIGELHDCMDQLVLGLNAIKATPPDERIPLACCAFSRYQHCSMQPIKRSCKSDSKAVDYIGVKMIKGYASEVLDLACQGFEWEGERCSKLKVPDGGLNYREGRIIKSTEANIMLANKTASLLPPFISIFTKL